MSNNQEILNQLPEAEILSKKTVVEQSDQESIHKGLSILWSVKSDKLRMKFLTKSFLNTNSGLLSLVSSIFPSLVSSWNRCTLYH